MEMPPGVDRNFLGQEEFDYTVDVAKNVKSAAKNSLLYITNGFRTAEGMIQAIEENWADGVGLGRPICAEPGKQSRLV